MRIVVALGGNALLRRGEVPTAAAQRANLRRATAALAGIARRHALVITHGNGPQVGFLALQGERGRREAPFPLDVLGAETEGMIGYLIEEELSGYLPDREVATLLTRTVVHPDDPAFRRPTKPIGPVYTRREAADLARIRGWTMIPDKNGYRRAVPSPEPRRIMEIRTIRLLLDHDIIVVCSGGGGIPVVTDGRGGIRGVEAVIDKDLSAAMLADSLDADLLLILTDVDAVYRNWGTKRARRIRRATPRLLRRVHFASGSMGPKVEAACRFASRPGRWAAIGALEDLSAILDAKAGTAVRPDASD